MENLDRCAIHTITTKQWDLPTACARYAAAGVPALGIWRQWLEGRDLAESRKLIEDNGLTVVSLMRGGFFPGKTEADRQKAIDENRQCLDEAAAIGAGQVVLVTGADPKIPLPEARRHITDGIVACIPHAADLGVKLAIEPLHPMYADCRSAVNTIAQANDIIDEIGAEWVGIAVDAYHVWWDPNLEAEVARAGERICALHVCDWLTPTVDFLNDRGLMGEGCIDIPHLRRIVDATGFDGFIEVEIFSDRHWKRDPEPYLEDIIDAYLNHV